MATSIDDTMDDLTACVERMSPIRELSEDEKSFVSSTDFVGSVGSSSGSSASDEKLSRGISSGGEDDVNNNNLLSPSFNNRSKNMGRGFVTPPPDRNSSSSQFRQHAPNILYSQVRSPKKKLYFNSHADDDDESDAEDDDDDDATVQGPLQEIPFHGHGGNLSFRDNNLNDSRENLDASFNSSICGAGKRVDRSMMNTSMLSNSNNTARGACSISPISSPIRHMHGLRLQDNVPYSPNSMYDIVKTGFNPGNSALSSPAAAAARPRKSLIFAESPRINNNTGQRKVKQMIDDSAYDTSDETSPITSGNVSLADSAAAAADITTSFNRSKRDLDSSFESRQASVGFPSQFNAAKKRASCSSSAVSRLLSDFEYMKQLGHGQFGSVTLYRNCLDGQLYAIKKLRRPQQHSLDEKRALMEVWAHAWPGSCKHLVRYYSAWVEAEYMYVQNEYCNGGSLERLLNRCKQIGKQLTEADLVQIVLQIAAALHDMHRRKIAHLDVKPANIFICRPERDDDAIFVMPNSHTPSKSVEKKKPVTVAGSGVDADTSTTGVTYKLGDLGRVVSFRAATGGANNNNNGICVDEGDDRYMAPELLEFVHKQPENIHKVDIYSLALSVYEAGGWVPPEKDDPAWTVLRTEPTKLQMRLPQCSVAFNNLLRTMVSTDPATRPSASELLKHPTLVPDKTPDELKRELNAARFDNHVLSRQLVEYEKLLTATMEAQIPTPPDMDTENKNIYVSSNIHVVSTRPILKIRKPSTKVLYHANSCTY